MSAQQAASRDLFLKGTQKAQSYVNPNNEKTFWEQIDSHAQKEEQKFAELDKKVDNSASNFVGDNGDEADGEDSSGDSDSSQEF